MEFIKIDGTSINKASLKGLSYSKFKKIYEGKFRKTSIEVAARLCGIKVPEPKVETPKENKPKKAKKKKGE